MLLELTLCQHAIPQLFQNEAPPLKNIVAPLRRILHSNKNNPVNVGKYSCEGCVSVPKLGSITLFIPSKSGKIPLLLVLLSLM
jgi:hypothetical protein